MMKNILATFVLLLVLASSLVAQTRIGFLNPQLVLDQLPEREVIERQLNRWLDEKEAEFEELAVEFQRELRRFQEVADDLSPSELQRRQRNLQTLNQQLEEFQIRVERDLERRQAELLQPILMEIDQIIEEIAKSKGLTYVLNQATAEGELFLIHVSEEVAREFDLTPLVLERLLN